MSILDIELGGACNMCCVYCDTPTRNRKIQYTFSDIQELICAGNISWLFICGLGEPTIADNICLLKQLLALCKDSGVKCCLFSNIVNFDKDLFSYIDSETLYPMFKLDSTDPDLLTSLYGVDRNVIDRHLNNVQEMCKHVICKDNYTNVCASIVPTKKNFNQVPELVQWCFNHNIFPLIGDLENAGQGQSIYDKLKVSENDLLLLKKQISEIISFDYEIPICPSVLFGIHINNTGCIIVDKLSGLSCHWFWLKEPQVEVLSHIGELPFDEISQRIIDNRKSKIENVMQIMPSIPSLSFGGCGGNIKELLSFYINNLI